MYHLDDLRVTKPEVKSYNLSIVMFKNLFCLEIIKLTI